METFRHVVVGKDPHTGMNMMEFAEKISTELKKSGALSISATEIGYPSKVFALDTGIVSVFFNPKIITHTVEETLVAEPCVSIPYHVLKIKRYNTIEIRATTAEGKIANQKYTGLTAARIQHEIDHLNDFDFTKRAGAFEKSKFSSKKKKFERSLKSYNSAIIVKDETV